MWYVRRANSKIASAALTSGLKLTAWLVYTDGHVINVEQTVSKEYMSTLDVFSSMSAIESKSGDHEVRNRCVG